MPPLLPDSADAPPAWHALPPDEVLRRLQVDADLGLDEAEVARRRARHGDNRLPEPAPSPAWRRWLRPFASPLVLILVAAAALALLLGHRGDAGVIALVIVVNALIGQLQEGRAERSMAALRRLSALQASVLRDGRAQSVAAAALVPGDILLLAAGDAVGADARLLEAVRLQAAEAALTGESVPVAKSVPAVAAEAAPAERASMLHSGTHLSAGRARAVVVATGAATEVGRIAGLTAAAVEPATPLERRIARFGRALAWAALGLFLLVPALGLLRGLPAGELLMVAVSQMVSMVPEGLPVAVTLALAAGMQRMAAQGAIIRRLSAVETLGATTVICTDKTGTLTRNEMTVQALWCAPQPDGAALAPRDLLEAAVLCSDAEAASGDPTEVALVVAAARQGLEAQALRRQWPRLAEQPFDAQVQRMATLHRPLAPGEGARLIVKGAPEAVLARCRPGPALHAARAQAEAMAAQALRVLAVAERRLAPDEAAAGLPAEPADLGLLGLVGQIDPPREEARDAVAACRAAGIRTVMITGDHALTGLAIARRLDIARDGDQVMDGAALERLDAAGLREALPRVAVFARVQPAQKLRIVEALQAGGEVVAMTGDGVNDAPALAQADVGVAMGRTGTEVAKGAAKVVLTDDRFTTLVEAVRQGRAVSANLKKVILFLFATSLDEVALLLLALLAGWPMPLDAVQILWINLVTEATLTLALVLDPPEAALMRRPPRPRDDALVGREAIGRIALMALATVCLCTGWMAWRQAQGVPAGVLRTEVFTLLVLCQWFNLLNCRSAQASALSGLTGAAGNRWLLAGLGLSVVLQALVLAWPPLAAMFHTVPLPAGTLAALTGLAAGVMLVEELRKARVRRRARGPRRAGG